MRKRDTCLSSEKKEKMSTETVEYTPEDIFRLRNEYWSKVQESEGFDVEGIKLPPFGSVLMPVDCRRGFHDRTLVKRYALVGLHRYNMLQGTNFVLDAVQKYNFSAHFVSSY